MPLTREQVKIAIEIVAADSMCNRVIQPDPGPDGGLGLVPNFRQAVLETFGLSGWTRNAQAYVLNGAGLMDQGTYEQLMCGGIAAVTVAALRPRRIRIPHLQAVEQTDPRSAGGWAHIATLLRMDDNAEYVLDWHKTLNVYNPWVSRYADWWEARNEVPFVGFFGFEDSVSLTPAQRMLVGKWTVTVGRWSWVYDFDDRFGVTWTDPANGTGGRGSWLWRGSDAQIELTWIGSGTKERWFLPLNPADQKGVCHTTGGSHPLRAVKLP